MARNLMSGLLRHRGWLVTLAAVLPLGLCALLTLVRDEVTSATAALILVLVVVGAAATGVRLAGLAAVLSSVAWFDFFLTEPYLTFTIDDRDDVEVTVLLMVIGFAVSELALWGRRQQERASTRAGYIDGVATTSELIALHREPPARLAELVAARVAEVLGVSRCRFVNGTLHDRQYAVLQHDGSVVRAGTRLDVDRTGLPTDREVAVPVRRDAQDLGYFLVSSAADAAYPSLEQRRLAVLLADRLGSVL
jgi:K+-sensing histidine kinase KdpD